MASVAIVSKTPFSASSRYLVVTTNGRQCAVKVGPSRSQTRTFFGSSSRNQGHHQQSSSNSNSSSQNGQSHYSRFERGDPGLKWTATISNPASVSGPEGVPSRTEQVENLKKNDSQEDEEGMYDVLVIGGGATGAGIAMDASHRGLKTACIERGDFASETSSRSTKLIWAGLKYMGTAVASLMTPQNHWQHGTVQTVKDFFGELKMVLNCHLERHYMTTKNKHLCHWIPIAVPFKSWTMTEPPPMNFTPFCIFPMVAPAVFKAYDALSGFSCPPSYVMGANGLKQYFPQLDADKLKYCSVFYEAQHNDARTNLAIAMTAAAQGAHICNYVAATELIRDEQTGQVQGATVVDRMTNESFSIRAKQVVFAGGPFTDGLRQLEANPSDSAKKASTKVKPAVRGASGTHVVLPGHLVPQKKVEGGKQQQQAMGLLDPATSDGRFLFILPWLGHTLIGTTDKKCDAQTLPSAPQNEINWILQESCKYWKEELKPEFTNKPENVLSAWRGWRPLAVDPHAEPDAPVSRDHVISQNPVTKCWFIAGGKWTTWREMAQDVVDKMTTRPCDTLNVALWGSEGYSETLAAQLRHKYPVLDQDVCDHLVSTYGGRAWEVCSVMEQSPKHHQLHQRLVQDFPYLEAEVIYACREYACNVEDVLSRRTRLAYLNREAALQALPRVAQLMSQELKWTESVEQHQIHAARAYVESYGGPSSDVGLDIAADRPTTTSADNDQPATPIMMRQ